MILNSKWFGLDSDSAWGFDTDATATEAAATDIFINEECDQKSNEVLIVPRKRERERERAIQRHLCIPVDLIKTASLGHFHRESEREVNLGSEQ